MDTDTGHHGNASTTTQIHRHAASLHAHSRKAEGGGAGGGGHAGGGSEPRHAGRGRGALLACSWGRSQSGQACTSVTDDGAESNKSGGGGGDAGARGARGALYVSKITNHVSVYRVSLDVYG